MGRGPKLPHPPLSHKSNTTTLGPFQDHHTLSKRNVPKKKLSSFITTNLPLPQVTKHQTLSVSHTFSACWKKKIAGRFWWSGRSHHVLPTLIEPNAKPSQPWMLSMHLFQCPASPASLWPPVISLCPGNICSLLRPHSGCPASPASSWPLVMRVWPASICHLLRAITSSI